MLCASQATARGVRSGAASTNGHTRRLGTAVAATARAGIGACRARPSGTSSVPKPWLAARRAVAIHCSPVPRGAATSPNRNGCVTGSPSSSAADGRGCRPTGEHTRGDGHLVPSGQPVERSFQMPAMVERPPPNPHPCPELAIFTVFCATG